VIGDADRLQQVVWNLLSNAVKFTDSGGTVTIALDGVEKHARVTVSDNGRGVSPTFLPDIFQRFTQAEAAASRRYGGLGLGLALVRELVDLHGGSVTAESDGLGLGARFTVLLPSAAWAVPVDAAPRPGVVSATELYGVKILLVEDDSDALEVITRTVVEAGASVVTARSSHEALSRLRSGQGLPHLIVSDIGLPGEDGYAFLRALRQEPPAHGGTLPAIAVSAFAAPGDRANALAAGYSSHLSKPFTPSTLVTLISRAVGDGRGRQPAN
jgi:CheY-like chemotaxis protein